MSLCQFHQYFTRTFFVQKCFFHQTVTREKQRKALLYEKHVRKMLIKLTRGVKDRVDIIEHLKKTM